MQAGSTLEAVERALRRHFVAAVAPVIVASAGHVKEIFRMVAI
jgi:hypothetical protein